MTLNQPCRNHPNVESQHICMVCQAHLCDNCIVPSPTGSEETSCVNCGGKTVALAPAASSKRNGRNNRKKGRKGESKVSLLTLASGIVSAPRETIRNLEFDLAESHRTGRALLFVLFALAIGSTVRLLAVPVTPETAATPSELAGAISIDLGVRLVGILITAIVMNLGAVVTGQGTAFVPFLVTMSFLFAALELLAAPVTSLVHAFAPGYVAIGAGYFFELWQVVLIYIALSEVYACDFISALLIGIVGRGVVVVGTLSVWGWISTWLEGTGGS
jgi:hypothetical protein